MRSLLVHIGIRLDKRYPVEEGGRVETVLLSALGTQIFEGSELICSGPADDVFDNEAKTEDGHQVANSMYSILRRRNNV